MLNINYFKLAAFTEFSILYTKNITIVMTKHKKNIRETSSQTHTLQVKVVPNT